LVRRGWSDRGRKRVPEIRGDPGAEPVRASAAEQGLCVEGEIRACDLAGLSAMFDEAPGTAALRVRGLSEREIEVLTLVSAGFSNHEIGQRDFS
jgi:ATP/maltotriose-dependent transcriptional regulator MalT